MYSQKQRKTKNKQGIFETDPIDYKFLSAFLINSSTVSFGVSFRIAVITFSDCLLLKPKTSNADNASSLLVLFELKETSSISKVFKILSFKSTITRCAVLAPIPLTD